MQWTNQNCLHAFGIFFFTGILCDDACKHGKHGIAFC